MNADELADELIEVTGELWISRQCATMLRQQQAEIKRLEEQLSIAYEENDNYWIEKGKEK